MVHLCAPTTYAKQDKQLCDSKIYDFKHEGYHTVNCISKELGYRDNRGTRRRRCFTEFLPTWSTSRLERGWYQTTNTTKVVSLILP